MGYIRSAAALIPGLGLPVAGSAATTGLAARSIFEVLPENIKDGMGLSVEKIAEGETYDPDKDKFTSGGIDDWFRDLVTGTGAQVREKTKQNKLDELNKIDGVTKNTYRELGVDIEAPSFRKNGFSDESTEDFKGRKDSYKNKLDLLTAIDTYGGSLAGVTGTTSVSELNKLLDDSKTKYQREKDLKDPTSALSMTLRNQEQQRLDREYEQNMMDYRERVEQGRLAHSTAQTNSMNAHNAAESNKRIAFEREVQNQKNQQTMQLAMMDRQDKMADRALVREDRAASQRQQSIMALIKGLSQMGAGFAI